jgi:hypothetical protein
MTVVMAVELKWVAGVVVVVVVVVVVALLRLITTHLLTTSATAASPQPHCTTGAEPKWG